MRDADARGRHRRLYSEFISKPAGQNPRPSAQVGGWACNPGKADET
eukprot:COSAG02_NODE_677_length_18591_cov_105.949221_9_plen_46_part_00